MAFIKDNEIIRLEKKYGILALTRLNLGDNFSRDLYIRELSKENWKLYGSTIVFSSISILVLVILIAKGWNKALFLFAIIPFHMIFFSTQKIIRQSKLIEDLKNLTST